MSADAQTFYEQAVAAHEAGQEAHAEDLAVGALAAEPDAKLATRIQHLRGRILAWSDRPLRGHELLVTEATALEPHDPRYAALMWMDASQAALSGGELAAALRTGRRSVDLGRRVAPELLPALELSLGLIEMLGEKPIAGRNRMLTAVGRLNGSAVEESWELVQRTTAVLFWLEEYDRARMLLEQLVERARSSRLRMVLPVALDTLAALDYRLGRWAVADARSAEAVRMARELNQTFAIASGLSTLAGIASARGDEATCRAYADEALALEAHGFVGHWARLALGSLALSQGKTDEAIVILERIANDDPAPDPAIASWPRDLVEAYVRAGRHEEAEAVADNVSSRLVQTRRAGLRALEAHCRGLVADTGTFADHFEESLHWHNRTPTPFFRARTELVYGERLRRARRNAEAKEHLQLALAAFEQLGARLWAERARAELSSGRRAKRGPAPLRDLLTPHELEVAVVVGRGATNKEAAAALFVSPKTIDYHLASIYRKLEVRSRTELAALIARESA